MRYQKSNLIFDGDFIAPTKHLFDCWLDLWHKEIGKSDLDLYLCGSFCSKYFADADIECADIDVVLSGNSFRYGDLKKYLDSGIQIGFDLGILVDIIWRDRRDISKIEGRETKITNYRDIIVSNESGEHTYIVEGDCKELIPGLYMFSNYDTTWSIEKARSKNYDINYIKIDYEHVKRKS